MISNHIRWWMGALALVAAAQATHATEPADLAAENRGQLLYFNHCIGCHDSVLHVRQDRRANSVADVARRVRHWSDIQHLDWPDDDVAVVTEFLVQRYYRFDDAKPQLPPFTLQVGPRIPEHAAGAAPTLRFTRGARRAQERMGASIVSGAP